jgi:putative phosphoribosyl transferase
MAALPFRDRSEAGQALARQLSAYKNQSDVLVLALPRGGVPVAYEVARALEAPLDIFLVRKLGVPGHEELAMGAIASGGLRVMNDEIVAMHRLSEREIDPVVARETAEIARRERRYRGDHPPEPIQGSIAILIDDGLATGATMRAAVRALRRQQPAKIVVAVPVAAASTCADLREEADEVVCALTPEPFHAVGLWYQDFTQTTDDEVRTLLDRLRQQPSGVG